MDSVVAETAFVFGFAILPSGHGDTSNVVVVLTPPGLLLGRGVY
jgi:hypothetical protein